MRERPAYVKSFDTIVVGLGAMGSAAAWQLARRGKRVLAFDRFDPPHTLGSTHGRTRITREAYFEDPCYVPLVRRSFEVWKETERAAGEQLFLRTGGLMIGLPEGEIVSGSVRSAREQDVPHQILTSAEIRARFPALHPREDMVGLLEERAGILFPERIVASQLRLALTAGATVQTNQEVTSWRVDDHGVHVRTSTGEHHAERLILAAGPWMPDLLDGFSIPLQCERQLMYWFAPVNGERFPPAQYPIALWDDPGTCAFATFPDLGDGVKVALHHGGAMVHPDQMDRTPRAEDEQAARDRLARYLPAANGALREAAVCIYTNTPDDHFIIDFLDESKRVLVVSPCSGHGFKFASAIGESVACLASDAPPPVDLSLFSLRRFRIPAQPP